MSKINDVVTDELNRIMDERTRISISVEVGFRKITRNIFGDGFNKAAISNSKRRFTEREVYGLLSKFTSDILSQCKDERRSL